MADDPKSSIPAQTGSAGSGPEPYFPKELVTLLRRLPKRQYCDGEKLNVEKLADLIRNTGLFGNFSGQTPNHTLINPLDPNYQPTSPHPRFPPTSPSYVPSVPNSTRSIVPLPFSQPNLGQGIGSTPPSSGQTQMAKSGISSQDAGGMTGLKW